MKTRTTGLLSARRAGEAEHGPKNWLKRVALAATIATVATGIGTTMSFAQEAGAQQPAGAETENAKVRLKAGTLACKGEGGWGAIVYSKKSFDCTFTTADGGTRSSYQGTITKFGIDIGVTGDTALLWVVFGPAKQVAENFQAGSLAGDYIGVGVEATAGAGLGANALVGGNESQFVLQPVSVQVQTGLSVAAAVQTFKLEYLGPVQ